MSEYKEFELEAQMEWSEAAERLKEMKMNLRECLEVIYPAYRNFVAKIETTDLFQKNYLTEEQVFIKNLEKITYAWKTMSNIDFEGHFHVTFSINILHTESNLFAFLLLAGHNKIHPHSDWCMKNWEKLDRYFQKEYKKAYVTYVQEIEENLKEYRFKCLGEACQKKNKEIEALQKKINSLPDEIYRSLIQKAQEEINRGGDIDKMKIALLTLLDEEYYSEINKLRRQPYTHVNNFGNGSVCNQIQGNQINHNN